MRSPFKFPLKGRKPEEIAYLPHCNYTFVIFEKVCDDRRLLPIQ